MGSSNQINLVFENIWILSFLVSLLGSLLLAWIKSNPHQQVTKYIIPASTETRMETKKPRPTTQAFNPATNSYVSLYEPPTGFCDCVDCNDQYRSLEAQTMDRLAYGDSLSPAEASKISTSFATDIKSDLLFLRDIIERHGNTILSRVSKLVILLPFDLYFRFALPRFPVSKQPPATRYHGQLSADLPDRTQSPTQLGWGAENHSLKSPCILKLFKS